MDKTLIEFEDTVIENKTIIELEKTVIENNNFNSISLQKFRDYRVVKEFDATGSEADTFLIQKEKREYFLKLYRKGVKVNEELLELIYKISKEYSYFNEILEFGYDEALQRYYEISNYLPLGSIKTLNYNSAKNFIKQLNEALHILHQHNIIHRDLKPTNILVKKEHPLKIALIDFGVSSLLDDGFTKKLTTVKGTYAYFSPEGISGYIGKESDYFSFGMVLLGLLDKNPFSGLDNAVIINSLVTQNVTIPSNLEENYQTLLKGLLTRDPKKRWGYNEVNKWLAGKEVKVYFDEEEDTSKKYKFQGRYYTLKELAIAFLQETNFELAQKHIGRGYITKFLERIEEYDLAIDLDEQEKLLNKLVLFVYSIQRNLDLILYGRVIDKEYIFSLLLKKVANRLNELENKIFNIISKNEFVNTITIYEKLTNISLLKDFFIKIDFSDITNFLDIERIIDTNDEDLIDLAIKYLNIDSKKILKFLIKKNKEKFINKVYKKINFHNLNSSDYDIVCYLINKQYEIDSKEIKKFFSDIAFKKKDEKVIEFLLLHKILPDNKKLLEKYLISKSKIKDLPKYYSEEEIFNFLKRNIQYIKLLYQFLDSHQNSKIFNMVLEKKDKKTIEFLLSKKVMPLNKDLLQKYLISNNQINELLKYIFKDEIFNFLKRNTQYIPNFSSINFIFDKNKISLLLDETLIIQDGKSIKFLLQKNIKPKKEFFKLFEWLYDNHLLKEYLYIFDYKFFKKLLEKRQYYKQKVIYKTNERIIGKHNNSINSVAISNNGQMFLSHSPGKIIIWNAKNKKYIRTIFCNNINSVESVAIFSKISDYILCNGIKEILVIFLDNYKESFKNYEVISSLASGKNLIVYGTINGFINIIKLKLTGQDFIEYSAHEGYVKSVIIGNDDKFIISVGQDNVIKIWDIENKKFLKTIKRYKEPITSIALADDNKYIIFSSVDKEIKIWDIKINRCIRTLTGHISFINSIAVSKGNRFIVSGSKDGIIKIWDFNTGECIKSFIGHNGSVNSIVISSNNEYILSGGDDKIVKIWELEEYNKIELITYVEKNLKYISFNITIKLLENYLIDLKNTIDDCIEQKDNDFLVKIIKNISDKNILSFLKNNPNYIKYFLEYIDKSIAVLVFNDILLKKKKNLVELFLKKDILPNNKNLLLEYLISGNRIMDIKKYFSTKEIFDFVKQGYIECNKEFIDIFNKTQLLYLLDIAIQKNNFEITDLFIYTLGKKGYKENLKKILLREYKKNNQKVVEIFKKNIYKVKYL